MKKMRIRIGRDGKARVQVEGAVGEECLDFTKVFEEAMGEVEERIMCEDQESAVETLYDHERYESAD